MDWGCSSVIKPLSGMSKALGSVPSTYADDDDNDNGRLYYTAVTPLYEFIANSHPCSCFLTSVGYVLILETLKIPEELKKILLNFCYFCLFVCLYGGWRHVCTIWSSEDGLQE